MSEALLGTPLALQECRPVRMTWNATGGRVAVDSSRWIGGISDQTQDVHIVLAATFMASYLCAFPVHPGPALRLEPNC